MINKDTTVVMHKICRSCMCESEEMRNVFETKEAEEGRALQLAEMLMACTSIQITSDDGLPVQLCLTCETKLDNAFEFKQQCEKTDRTLRKLTNQPIPKRSIKQEDIIVQPDLSIPEIYNDATIDSDSSGLSDKKQICNSNKDTNIFTCNYCHKVLRTRKGLKIHQRRHTGEKLRSCHLCQAKFTRTNHLRRHIETHNKASQKSSHICVECGASFTKAYHLVKHKKEHKLVVDIKKEDDNDKSNNVDDEDFDENCDESEEETEEHSTENSEQAFRRSKRNNSKKRIELDDDKGDKERKIMQCEFCDRKFKYKKSFVHHMQTEHGMSDDSDAPLSTYVVKSEGIECDNVENAESTNDNNVQDTETIEIGHNTSADGEAHFEGSSILLTLLEKGKRHCCHVCDSKFARANHLTRHMTLHRAVLTHKCDRCDKAFASAEYLSKHNQEEHINKPYICTMCNKSFGRGEHLIRHLRMHNTKGKTESLQCSICEKVFARSGHLARHTKIHLQQDKRHVCNECGKAFNRLDNLKTHQRVHTGLKDNSRLHLCVYCGKEFNNSSNMIVHMRRHTGERPYKCSICSKGFPRSHDLKCHERTHSGEKPYLCTLCGKSFNKSNKLLRHTRVHTGERPYVCNLCDRAFTQSNDLALHMRRHTGSRPYACGVCSARFIQSGQLKAHRRSTGHWMEIQPDLKGGHRVEPVTPLVNPAPIKFKTQKYNMKSKLEMVDEDIKPQILNQTVGIMRSMQSDLSPQSQQPVLLEGTKLLQQFHNAGFVGFTSVINTTENNKVEIQNIPLPHIVQKPIENSKIEVAHPAQVTYTTVESPSTFTNTERYNFQNYG